MIELGWGRFCRFPTKSVWNCCGKSVNAQSVLARLKMPPSRTKGSDVMKGHIRERSPGHWAIILDALDPATGKRKRKWHSFKGTKREAQVRCAELIASRGEGRYVEPGRMTVGECLDRWLIHVRTLVSPRAHECYGETVNFNLKPALGAV